MSFLKKISDKINYVLETAFYKLGFLIGSRPKTTLIITALASAVCLAGLANFTQESRLRKLWVPPDSQVIKDRDFVDLYFPARFFQGIYIGKRSPVGGDAGVLEAAVLRQLFTLHDDVLDINATHDGVASGWSSIAYSRSEGGNYWSSSIFALWQFDGDVINNLTTADILAKVNQRNLLDPWNGGLFKLSSTIGGIRRNAGGDVTGAEAIQGVYRIIANRTFNTGTGEEVDERADDWSKQYEAIVRRDSWTQFTEMTVFTEYGLNEQAGAAISGDIRLLSAGYILILVYVILNLGRYNRLEHKVWLSVSGIISTGLAIGVSFGLCSAFGFFYGPVHSVLPFLLLGIGVDDMFVIIEVWNNMTDDDHKNHSVPERLGICLSHAGVSVTVTSITDLAAFLIGTITILPALQSFCVFAGVGVFFDLVLQVTFFAATVALDAQRIDERRDACCFCARLPDDWQPLNIQGRWLSRYFRNYHTKFLAMLPVKIFVIIVTLAIGGLSIWAATRIDIQFNFLWFLPGGSYILDYDRLSEQYFATSSIRFSIYLGDEDYTSPGVQGQLNTLINRTRIDEYVSKDVPVDTWLEGLQAWPSATNISGDNFYPSLTSYLGGPGVRFAAALNVTGGLNITAIRASSFSANFISLPHSRDEINALDSLQALTDSVTFPNGRKAFAYSRFFLGWTTNKVIDRELIRNLLLAMGAVFIVTLLLLADLLASLYVLACVALTVVDTVMVMHFWDLTINTVTAVILILSIGLAVDYCAHIAHFFKTCQLPTRQERVSEALSSAGVAVFNGGFSTFLAFVLLSISSSYIFSSFFKILLAVVLFGLWHGLVFLPVVLSLIGPASHSEVPTTKLSKSGSNPSLSPVNGDIEMRSKPDNQAPSQGEHSEQQSSKWAESRGYSPVEDDRVPECV